MEILPNFYICEVYDADYDNTLAFNTCKFFDSFIEAKTWLTETCQKRAKELYKLDKVHNSKSLFGRIGHYYAGRTISLYSWDNERHEYDSGEYQLECRSLHAIGYPRNDGYNLGNLISLMSHDEKDWLINYVNPNNTKGMDDLECSYCQRVYDILNNRYEWDEIKQDWIKKQGESLNNDK